MRLDIDMLNRGVQYRKSRAKHRVIAGDPIDAILAGDLNKVRVTLHI